MSQEEARNRRRRELYSQRMAAETKVSPTLKEVSKTFKMYFGGTFSDESGCKRFVSFKTSLFEPMKEAKENGISVGVNNCVIKRSSFNTDDLEIIVSDKSELLPSPIRNLKLISLKLSPLQTPFLSLTWIKFHSRLLSLFLHAKAIFIWIHQ